MSKYLKAAAPAEKRIRTTRFLQNGVAGVHEVYTWHGTGSTQAQMLTLYRITHFKQEKKLAKELAGIED